MGGEGGMETGMEGWREGHRDREWRGIQTGRLGDWEGRDREV
jgi:hypothetical protein